MENNNKKLHGILGLILNAFYFFIGAHYLTTCHTTSILWYIVLIIAFSVYIGYCYTLGVKWEIKHIQFNKEKIESMEKKIESMEKSINYLMQCTPLDAEKYDKYLNISEQEGFDPITHQRL
jgi:hypothetical protein|uniref:Heat shock factor binding protein 1 n=1 Tax=Bacteriophage sp. TaxID=38018 RepID=A0A8D9PEX0_9VIRU|nr:MAG TPA: Heat shock factor binding protein 1 [Bacteriophage sp.]